MRVYKNEIKPDQIGDVNKYKSLGALIEILNLSNQNGNRGSLRAIRLIHQFNQWISSLEKGKIVADKGMFSRELKWYENRSAECLGESFIRNYIKARSRRFPKKLLVDLRGR